MSPYVVTTWTENVSSAAHAEGYTQEISSRLAVATLDEAERMAYRVYRDAAYYAKSRTDDPAWLDAFTAWPFPEQGCTVALPDGTVIEVRDVQWRTLCDQTGCAYPGSDDDRACILAAYNAQQREEATR